MCTAISADSITPSTNALPSFPGYSVDHTTWGGHLRGLGTHSWGDADSVMASAKQGPYNDGSFEFRLKNETQFHSNWRLDVHYEAIYSGGDLHEATRAFSDSASTSVADALLPGPPDDETKFFDLTHIIKADEHAILYHRLDRLALTVTPAWGTIRIGRQALTWGNGLLFNPMDLFNPFAPTDVLRDYKSGDDMVSATLLMASGKEMQLLYVPRRNASNGEVEWDSSSVAGKLHGTMSGVEFDLMAAKHYEDHVLGIGGTGYLMAAAWRTDITYTFLDEESDKDGFFSAVANIDYSWTWGHKNCYGFLEFYYNGLGDNNSAEAIRDEDSIKRISRGEIFTLGTSYLGGTFQIELHPLVNFHITAINNLHNPSGVLQPRITWDTRENLQVTAGATGNWGGTESEFGGFTLPGTDLHFSPLNNAYLWITFFF